ncbi:Bug family tripartite tricarboxylate transporter substrate binding protein [Paracoccus versutus]|uniref:Tripartite-type tricarboxylate transporter receptor subunit TctC n=1 Tax=Paracoccus versutus TaxID=34007 RepID=A0A3D9XUH7_PARVE|nr:tripartite tricarboxylate transporter substrate binding protein [Paracoccus versutus]REF73288.1 tripartite-type tricarboxylate transporter receptor subunit TctC [Paracoccus versutus]
MKLHTKFAVAIGLALTMASPLAASAQDYPDRPVQIIVPLSPGSLSDLTIRKLAPDLAKTLGTSVVIDNRPGAGAAIGTAAAKQEAPDGYTLVLAAASSFSINPHLREDLAYDPMADFAPICRIGGAPQLLAANPSLGVTTAAELVEKAKTETIPFASSGPGTISHLAQEMLKSRMHVDFLHAPYKGTGPAITDTIAGHTKLMFESPGPMLGAIREGQLVPLGVLSPQRLPALPDVPTFEELGFGDMELIGWIGLAAPVGTPAEVIDTLAKACETAVVNPDFHEFSDEQGLVAFFASPAEFAAHIKADFEKFGALVERSGLQPE